VTAIDEGQSIMTSELPKTMRAAVMKGYGGPDQLAVETVPVPTMMPHNEVMIAVHAAGLNPFDAKLRRGWLAGLFPLSFPHIPGADVAGTIVATGFDVTELAVGDRVYGLIDCMRPGAYAEYAVAPSYLVRKMPANLSFEEAAAVPMAACTAWHGLVNLADIKPGLRVLVQAGAGGVGMFAIQIAKAHGAHVTTTARAAAADTCLSFGADEVIDYGAEDFTARGRVFDIVLDVIGGEVGQNSYKVLKPGGTLLVVLRGDQIEMANRDANMAEYGVTTKVVAFSAQPEILDQLRPLIEAGKIRVPLSNTMRLDEVARAHAAIDAGHARGKTVLKVAP
jgi:NADPH:quinone reductase-like Zn-dependent oxidoreductase